MKYLLSCFLILCSLYSFAQKPTVTEDFKLTVGPKYKRVSNTNEYHFAYGQQMLSLKKVKKAFVVQRHSLRNLTKLPKGTTVADKGQFAGVIQLKDTVLVFYRQRNKLIAQKLRVSTNQPVSSKTYVDSPNKIADDFGFSSRFGYDAGSRINAFAIKKSVDQSKFVIVCTDDKKSSDEEENGKSIVNITVYNADMTLDWKRSIAMPYNYAKMNADDFMVDADGNFYTLASVFEKKRLTPGKRNKEDSDFHMELFKASKDSEDWEIKKIETSKSIEDAVLYLNAFKKPVIVGFYAEKEVKGYVTGSFSAVIDSTKNNIKPILHPIATDTIKAYEKRKASQIKKGQRYIDDKEDMEDLHINKVIVQNDGSFNIFAEQRYTLRNSYYANGATTINYEFYYKTAYACKLDGKGNLLWFNQLPKNQYGKRGKQMMSYRTLKFGQHHYVLLWEKYGNLYKNIGEFAEILETNRREYMFLATFKINDATGEVEKLPVVNSLEVDKFRLSSFKMGKAALLNESDIVFEGYDGRGNYLFRLQLN